MKADKYTLKEQFVMETRVGVAFITSYPYDHYPTSKEIIEYLATLAPSNRSHGVRVVKRHELVEKPSEAPKMTAEAISSYMEQEETASQAAERIRREVFGVGVDAGTIKIIQTLEVKLAECERHMVKPKYIIMSTRMGRAIIPDPHHIGSPAVRYKGIDIMYVKHDIDEPLICW
jgi:hypothetical protein